MDDRKLKTLLATIRVGSFSKAAEELSCTQSAVTQAMNALEDELGCRLLARNHSGVRLTKAGEELLPYIIDAEAGLVRLREEADRVVKGAAIPLRIGSFASISNIWLPPLIQDYRKLKPEVSFDIRVGGSDVTDWLMGGDVDLVLGDADRCKGFRWYPLMEDPFYAVMHKELAEGGRTSITKEELLSHTFVMAPASCVASELGPLPAGPLTISCDDDSTLLSMVSQGLAVTAMPGLSLHSLPQNVRILELTPRFCRLLGVALPNSPSKAASEFAAFLRKRYESGQYSAPDPLRGQAGSAVPSVDE